MCNFKTVATQSSGFSLKNGNINIGCFILGLDVLILSVMRTSALSAYHTIFDILI
ncbi:unnamed protein product [Acanthoscelides obtectus]|uniref:Uncharacterized protein n=1 Tax=Acanthoscelides obtectus TaxID=200917 RepID=A0A9P0Q6T7_ACAOB|nr:unnamed protein product [Acanthoscelides obtectus]CAK1652134.1 hypothetical protein AOBTE_LOCUS17705 [Acanthoscelides obtectus]